MKTTILGAAGMLGRKLVSSILKTGELGGQKVSSVSLVDFVDLPPPSEGTIPVRSHVLDLGDPATAEIIVGERPDVIVHLASIVSGEAETDFERGYRINFDGNRYLLGAIRAAHESDRYHPRLVFTSSIAVFGAPFPEQIGDEFFSTPLTSYGTQKAITELLISDYSRRGILDGLSIRLPTLCVRPGKPNLAASGFFSNILREPLVGQPAILPVEESVRHWHASPRSAVGFVHHAVALDTGDVGARRALTMPGVSATVAEQLEALERAAGPAALDLIERRPDPAIAKIVHGWPRDFRPERALDLGFKAERTFDEIVQVHIEDELGGRLEAWEGK